MKKVGAKEQQSVENVVHFFTSSRKSGACDYFCGKNNPYMIQRIQSILLLLAGGASFGQFGLPYATGAASTSVAALSDGQLNLFDNVGLLALAVLGGAVSLIAIFMYKNRPLQARLTGVTAVVSILSLVLIGVVCKQVWDASSGAMQIGAGVGLPLVAMILQWLAGRSIRKDEKLVRSMDRLR